MAIVRTLLFLLLLGSGGLFAQLRPFEGRLTYAIRYEAEPERQAALSAIMPDTMEWQLRQGASFFEMRGGRAHELLNQLIAEARPGRVWLAQPASKRAFALDMLSQRLAWDMPPESGFELLESRPDSAYNGRPVRYHRIVRPTSHGYDTTELWTLIDRSFDIPNNGDAYGAGIFAFNHYDILGVPLRIRYLLPTVGVDVEMEIQLVGWEDELPPESLFRIPEDYEVRSYQVRAPK